VLVKVLFISRKKMKKCEELSSRLYTGYSALYDLASNPS
jgi:hypothetical protein